MASSTDKPDTSVSEFFKTDFLKSKVISVNPPQMSFRWPVVMTATEPLLFVNVLCVRVMPLLRINLDAIERRLKRRIGQHMDSPLKFRTKILER